MLQLLDSCNDIESEEHHKNLVIAFLKKTYYDPDHFVNTKGRTDLVIHNGDKGTSSVGVIVETKKPGNRHEMIREGKVNVKAFQELPLSSPAVWCCDCEGLSRSNLSKQEVPLLNGLLPNNPISRAVSASTSGY
uniref:DUF7149 domain-containing protein n=1 Tax=Marinilabilia salmonicolor TaxID=989 RepID=UPI00029A4745|nr:type iis restriction/modification enzyme [Marinilabilia salmonicolor]